LGTGSARNAFERGERDGLTVDERSDLVELRAENAQLRMERDLLQDPDQLDSTFTGHCNTVLDN
jgi:hypothetical protein